MDKDWKLQRYSKKDYTDLVEFPVEIVGRDGVVRRYSFEDSIRLYQRRITFAPIRYRDPDLVRAEVGHCRSRIDQLRRSFFHRFGWGTPEGEPEPLEVFGDVAGELAAFICRVFRCAQRPDVLITPVSDVGERVSSWHLMPRDKPNGMLLYVYRFDEKDADRIRERFFASLKKLEAVTRTDGETERLVAFHHTVDCGFVLTAKAGEYDSFEQIGEEDVDEYFPTPWDEALEVVRRGEFEEAVSRCRDIVTDQPWHRSAYIAGAVLSTALGRFYEAEDFALVGTRYFPDDGVLHYHVGVARHRMGRVEEAQESLKTSLSVAPEIASARFLLARILLTSSSTRAVLEVLVAGHEVTADNRRSKHALVRFEQWLRWRRVVRLVSAFIFFLGLVVLTTGNAIGILSLVVAVVMFVAGALVFRRQLEQLTQRQRNDELSRGLRRVHDRLDPDAQPVS